MRSRRTPARGNPFAADLLAGITALRLACDPRAIAAAGGLATLDPWQERVLDSTALTLLINCSRQAGKSTICAVLIVAELLKPGRTVVIVAPSERQSKELYRKVLSFWRRLGKPIAHVTINRTSLELVNESRLLALPGKPDTIRGVSAVNLLIADEASVVADDLYSSVTPMLAVSNGRLVAPSTPKGKRGWWYTLWSIPEAEDTEIVRVTAKATEIPRIPASFLAREQRTNPLYLQEFDNQFIDQESQAFRTEDIEAAQVEGIETWDFLLSEEEEDVA